MMMLVLKNKIGIVMKYMCVNMKVIVVMMNIIK